MQRVGFNKQTNEKVYKSMQGRQNTNRHRIREHNPTQDDLNELANDWGNLVGVHAGVLRMGKVAGDRDSYSKMNRSGCRSHDSHTI